MAVGYDAMNCSRIFRYFEPSPRNGRSYLGILCYYYCACGPKAGFPAERSILFSTTPALYLLLCRYSQVSKLVLWCLGVRLDIIMYEELNGTLIYHTITCPRQHLEFLDPSPAYD